MKKRKKRNSYRGDYGFSPSDISRVSTRAAGASVCYACRRDDRDRLGVWSVNEVRTSAGWSGDRVRGNGERGGGRG